MTHDISDRRVYITSDGVIFYPANDRVRALEIIKNDFCKSHEEIYILNSLQLSKSMFSGLDIKPKHVKGDSGVYKVDTKSNVDGKGYCIQEIEFMLEINLVIEINGTEVRSNKDMYKEKEIISIKRSRPVVGNSVIKVTVKDDR